MGHRRSKDEVQKISTSIFVTNFPDQFYAKDLWKVCNQYENVIDAFIPNRRSKSRKRDIVIPNVEEENKPAIVLDEMCVNQQDYSTSLMGKVQEFGSLTNLKVVLANEGFDNIKLKYMGGYWVMINFQTQTSKEKFKANVGIGSWFSQLQQASNVFHIDERVIWVDIEGIPLKVWTKNTFNRISSKWDDLLHVEDQDEVFGWILDFVEDDEEESDSDDEIRDEGLHDESVDKHKYATVEGESDVEEVSETIFKNEQSQAHKEDDLNIRQKDIRSKDPFNIYDLLNKKQDSIIGGSSSDDSLKYPLRFTPTAATEVQSNACNKAEMEGGERLRNIHDEKVAPEVKKTCPLSNPKEDKEESIRSCHFKKAELQRLGGSMLQLMEDLVKVGLTMGYNMEGCLKNTEEIIDSQRVNENHR
ncbi:nucleotide-binding alpha-beta plait domain-containing protein [Tanacetum coccineum]|uniref:Nucleotide-binding alpha-beta plait domain-containing protein n=1 Tax=Tanacetum coccineum TaxID=301880 RepID=A0ABQ5E0P4_9ASTR